MKMNGYVAINRQQTRLGFAWFLVGMGFVTQVASAQIRVLNHLPGGEGPSNPHGGLVWVGSELYGTSRRGGADDYGTIFKVEPSSGMLTTLFSLDESTGTAPRATLTSSGSVLYGTASMGGAGGGGTVFKFDTATNDFAVLYAFSWTDGYAPYAGVTLVGASLYGTTQTGGDNGAGVVFKIDIETGEFSVVHHFSGEDGAYPESRLTPVGSWLYGTTSVGGIGPDPGYGTVFKIDTQTGQFVKVYEFDSQSGSYPYAGLTRVGSALYGTTYAGGSDNRGTIFRIDTERGDEFTLLHSFERSSAIGYPTAELTLWEDMLLGTTPYGGENDEGTIFKIHTDGSGFEILHHFSRYDTGAYPRSELLAVGSDLFGTAQEGGENDGGTVFALPIPEPSTIGQIAALAISTIAVRTVRRRMIRRRRRLNPAA